MFYKILYVLSNPRRWFRWVKYFFMDIRYGGRYLGISLQNSDPIRGYVYTGSSDYEAINKIFSHITINKNDVFVDVGCGKGRVFNWFLRRRLKNRMIGIEVDKRVAEFTRKRLKKYSQVEIITAAIEKENNILSQGTIFYLNNPFSFEITKIFSDHLAEQIQSGQYAKKKRRPVILCNGCDQLNVFKENPIWKIRELGILSFMNLNAAIIEPA